MNDPGLDGPLKEASNDLEDPYQHFQEEEEEEEENFLDPRCASTIELLIDV